MKPLVKLIPLLSALAMLSACDSSSGSDDSETDTAYFKLYVPSINASSSQIYLDDEQIGSVGYAKSFANYTLNNGSYAMSIQRVDSDGENQEVIAQDISIEDDIMSIYMLVGDYTQPELIELEYNVTEATDLEIVDDDDDPQFELFFAHVASDAGVLDIYYSDAEGSFAEAELLTSLGYKEFSPKSILIQETYKFYFTESGTQNLMFESPEITFSYLDTFVMAFRPNSGQSPYAIDQLTGFSAVIPYVDSGAEAEMQFYQSVDSMGEVDIYLGDTGTSALSGDLPFDQLSDVYLMDSGAYSVIATTSGQPEDVTLGNSLVNLNAGESKIVVIFEDEENAVQSLSLEKSSRALAYENTLTLVNLAKDYENVNVYFIEADENLDTASTRIRLLDFADTRQLTLTQREYQIMVTNENTNGNQTLLYQSDPMTLDANTNYLLVIEPDDNEFSGHRLSLVVESGS